MAIQLEILTPSQTLLVGTADEVVAPSESGEVTILPQHTEYISTLGPGRISVMSGGSTRDFQITGGLLQMAQDKMTILVDE